VVLRALVDDAICLRLEPNKPKPTDRAGQQAERHELAKIRHRGAARHAAVMLLDVGRGTGGRRVGRQLASSSSSSPQASCDGSRGAWVLLAREMAGLRQRRAGEAHERRGRGRVGCGCGGARGFLRGQLGLGASV
jgi:hypothetical protein